MKPLVFLLLSLFSIELLSQEVITDKRDGQEYRVGVINGKKWMLEDLNYFTQLSYDLTDEKRKETGLPRARWYHFTELETVCPEGWSIPTVEDWVKYFQYFGSLNDTKLKVRSHKETIRAWGLDEDAFVYEENNPLNLTPHMGMFEADSLYQYNYGSDYWIQDMPLRSELKEGDFKWGVRIIHPNRAHAHIYPEWIVFHSHLHHLDLNDSTTMRRFLVRCVCENE